MEQQVLATKYRIVRVLEGRVEPAETMSAALASGS